MKRTSFVAGNWKMNGSRAMAGQYAASLGAESLKDGVRVAVAAPFTLLDTLKAAFAGTKIEVFAQNMHFEDKGAYTGEISAPMLQELGVDGVIIGHSERRMYFGEDNASVLKKTLHALQAGLTPIVCFGEGLAERQSGCYLETVRTQAESLFSQLSAEQAARTVIAYEPIWAIGTGLSASPDQAQQMCAFIRGIVKDTYQDDTHAGLTILYGGSVNASNAQSLLAMPDIDGALVGGASLDAGSFAKIVNAAG